MEQLIKDNLNNTNKIIGFKFYDNICSYVIENRNYNKIGYTIFDDMCIKDGKFKKLQIYAKEYGLEKNANKESITGLTDKILKKYCENNINKLVLHKNVIINENIFNSLISKVYMYEIKLYFTGFSKNIKQLRIYLTNYELNLLNFENVKEYLLIPELQLVIRTGKEKKVLKEQNKNMLLEYLNDKKETFKRNMKKSARN